MVHGYELRLSCDAERAADRVGCCSVSLPICMRTMDTEYNETVVDLPPYRHISPKIAQWTSDLTMWSGGCVVTEHYW